MKFPISRKLWYPISRPCTFPPAHWRLILLIHDFSLVIGGKLHSEYLGFSLLVANYSRNIPFFLYWQSGCRHIATICSLNIPNNSLYNASYYMCRKITSHWQSLFSKKMAVVATFSYKIGGGLIFLQNWRRWLGFGNITGGVLTWSGYWFDSLILATKIIFYRFSSVFFFAFDSQIV